MSLFQTPYNSNMPYGSLSSKFYDIDKPQANPGELAYYLDEAQKSGGAVLEPMAGSGRFLIPLRDAGIDLDGFDASQSMVEGATRRLGMVGTPGYLSVDTFESFRPNRPYAMVMIPCESLSLLHTQEMVAMALRQIANWLQPGGSLVASFEKQTQTVDSSWPWGGRWITHPEGGFIVLSWLGRYDAKTHVNQSLLRYERVLDSKVVDTEMEEFNLRHYDRAELQELLLASGFSAIDFLEPTWVDIESEKPWLVKATK